MAMIMTTYAGLQRKGHLQMEEAAHKLGLRIAKSL